MDLSLNLRAIVSQRLIRALNGGLVPAVEVLLNTPYIADPDPERQDRLR